MQVRSKRELTRPETSAGHTLPQPAISVCMIVRNEEANLRDCLASVRDLASEIVVVDTGSTDSTVEIAQSFGAEVYSFPWVDDFAAARNESLSHATREWIFWLDADDRLAPDAALQVKRTLARGDADAYNCRVVSRLGDKGKDTTEHIRLFRNGIGIRFSGAVHETVWPDILRLGLQLAPSDIVIEHLGYLSLEALQKKRTRNLAILDRQIADNPDQLDLLLYRGTEADVRQYLSRTTPSSEFDLKRFSAYNTLASLLDDRGELESLGELLQKALGEFPGHPYFLTVQARIDMRLGNPAAALPKLQVARSTLHGTILGFSPPVSWVEMSLAECFEALHQREEAIRWAQQAQLHAADWGSAAALLSRLAPHGPSHMVTTPLQRSQQERRMRSKRRQEQRNNQTKTIAGPQMSRFRRFELTIEPKAPSRWPSISACMIAKNEANNIAPCLRSLEDLASEIIVVDTGSTDNTVEIAQSLGAKVYHFRWIDDFAAARNESLRHATKEWIFWLDADDRLTPKAVAQIKRAAASGLADAYSCNVSSKLDSGEEDITEHVRLFPNRRDIHFVGAIHETVWPQLVRLGLRLAYTDITVTHTGYPTLEVMREKGLRNLPMINRQLEQNPELLDLLFYRAQVYGNLRELDKAEADLREYLSRTQPSSVFEYKRFTSYTALARIYGLQGRRDAMESILKEGLAEFPAHPCLLYYLGEVHLSLQRPAEAAQELTEARVGIEGNVPGFRPPVAGIELSLVEAYRQLGNLPEAIRWAEQARTHDGQSREIPLKLARLYLQADRPYEAGKALSQLLPAAKEPEPWLLLAELFHRQGRWQEAAAAIEEARTRGLSKAQADEVMSRLKASRVLSSTSTQPITSAEDAQSKMEGLTYLAQGQLEKAVEFFAKAIEAKPTDKDSYRYLAVALQRLGREDEAIEVWQLAQQQPT